VEAVGRVHWRAAAGEEIPLLRSDIRDHAAVGVVNLTTDKSAPARRDAVRTGDKIELSFPLRVAALALASSRDRVNRSRWRRHIPMDVDHSSAAYYGPMARPDLSAGFDIEREVAGDAGSGPHRCDRATVTGRYVFPRVRPGHAASRSCHPPSPI